VTDYRLDDRGLSSGSDRLFLVSFFVKLSLCLIRQALCHENIRGNAVFTILHLCTKLS
jgi:hypothetical protein